MDRLGQGWPGRRLVGLGGAVAFVVASLAVASPSASALTGGSGIVSLGFNPTVARNNTALTLTVNTTSDTNCVQVSGAHTGQQTTNSGATLWTFSFTAGTGDGTRTVTVVAFKNKNCNGSSDTMTASYTLDNTVPTITGSRSPAANSNGWNNTDVAVTFSCADNAGGSGIASCLGGTTLTTEGAGKSVTGTATDNAGNSATSTVSNINIDKTLPSLTAAATTAPNAGGWYNGDVVMHWTCGDALSGIDGACPPNTTISGEGAALTSSASVSDKAGNATNATSPAVKIDRTAPTTTATAPPAWNNTDVTVSLNASDALSGVAVTHWTLDGGAVQTGASVPINTDGDHLLSYWSVDKADNVESAHSVHVMIDKTPPTISHTQAPSANADGWNNIAVTVTFSCADTVSGIASCTSPVTVSSEGASQTVTGTAVDHAGNTATDPATVNIDLTKPTIAASRDRAPNANGWYNADVTASFACHDALSGVKTCSPATTLGQGANQSATGSVTDAAGNTASVTDSGINVDETAPSIVGTPIAAPNADGWYDGDVTIHWTCTDALSGIVTCPADSIISGNGTALTVSAAALDAAGNTTVATSAPVNIDQVAPTTTSNAPSGWQMHDVTVHLSATDNLSGVVATYYTLNGGTTHTGDTVVITAEGTTQLSYWSVDDAGNVESAQMVSVQLDKTAPDITHTQLPPANAKGWNNSDVAVSFTCSDAVSGIATCPPGTTVSTEGAGQDIAGTATDNAGNSATDHAVVNLDKTPPTVAGAPDRAANANGWYNAPVTVSFSCTDSVSGVAACPGAQVLDAGLETASGTAIDNADNSATATVSGINIDTVAPSLSGAATTPPNGAGWYRADVTVEWTCSDDLSGIDGVCPPNSTIGGEGDNLSAAASVSDRAGNTTSASVTGVMIDRTAPATNALAPSEWTSSAVTVTLDPHDNLSGVAATYWSLDSGAVQTGTSVDISADGIHTLEYWSVDVAGNEESHHTATIKIDQTAPTITHTQSPDANGAGWNNTDVKVTFVCDDATSGVASCTAPQTVTSEGADQTVAGAAVDNAGNSASDTAHVSIDKTSPAITGAADRAANGNGWYNADVNVSFSCGDALSGVASCTGPVTLGEGAGQDVEGTATDAAGNESHATVAGINIDETDPTIQAVVSPSPNAAGWYHDDVTVHWVCADALSGIDGACPSDTVINGEGDNLSASASVSDRAGNSAAASVTGIKIDRTPPTTTSDAPADWQPGAVVAALTAHDGLAGVGATHYVLDSGATETGTTVVIAGEGVHTLEFWSIDAAGNVEAHHTATIKIDTTDPTISHTQSPPANANGWNNSDVTVKFHCADTPSGIASCTDPATFTGEGSGQTAAGVAVDQAGNTASDLATVNIDKTNPTITSARDHAANANGWYKDDVTVSFSCADALSGVATCPASRHIGEGADQSVAGTAFDSADNSASTTDAHINVDETAPELSGLPTTSPNADGWYHDDVVIHWTCSDALSGIDGTCPADSIITGEGDNLSASASVADRAGNATNATVSGIKIDRTAPSTDASAPSQWVNGDVTVTLSASDTLSGVAETNYILDGAAHAGTSISLTTEGVHTLEYWSVDKAGNEEPHSTITIRIDKSAPTITHTQLPDANANGWNNSDVTVTFSCDDGLSGIQFCTPAQHVASEGANQSVAGTAVDAAGNAASDTAVLNIDKTPPTISGAADRAANANGWYDANVTVSFSCNDALSGIESCSGPVTFGEGANHSATGVAADAAGNSTTTAVGPIDIDTTAPTLSGAPTTSPNADGWYHGDVVVHWTCSDALSGVDGTCPADTTITAEGGAVSASATVADRAGNSASATVVVKIDRTAPVTSSDAPAGWQNHAVTVHFGAADTLSGVSATYAVIDGGAPQIGTSATISSSGTHTVEYWSADKAGNAETHQNAIVQIDLIKPTITGAPTTAPNAAGWYRTPVTVHFSCADQPTLSGLASCSPDQTVATSGANQSATGIALDNAGNSASSTVGGLKIDLVSPDVVVSGITDGGTYALGAVPVAKCSASDTLSGPNGCNGNTTGGNSNGVGSFTFTATAFDVAGNSSTRVVHYAVDYAFSGFLQPINDTAHQVGLQTSVFKAGSTVPVKFQLLRADGSVVQSVGAPQWLTPVRGAALSASVDESLYGATATSGDTYRFDTAVAQYIYNWSTKGLVAGYYYRIGVRLEDGTVYTVNIGLR